MGYRRHRQLLSPVFEEGDPIAQWAGRHAQSIGLGEFDEVQLQDVPERDVGLAFIAHLKPPEGLLAFGVGLRHPARGRRG